MNSALQRVRATIPRSPTSFRPPAVVVVAAAAAAAAATWTRRSYAFQASSSPGAPAFDVFNRRIKWMQRERAASDVEASRQADYLKDEVAFRLCERLLDIKRNFPRALDLGANTCNIARALARPAPDPDPADPGRPAASPPLAARIGELVAAGSSAAQLFRDAGTPADTPADLLPMTRLVLEDEERLLDPDPDGPPRDGRLRPGEFDLVLSSMSLHWVNDLPGLLAQVIRLLRPDRPFVAAMLGGDSLFELRTSLQLAEQERRGGISPRVSPLADVRDCGGLLQRAGFQMLTVDVDDIIVDYPDAFELMKDLQAMGESNAVLGREMGPIGRDVLLAAQAIYRELHGNEDGSIPATFRIIYMIGWRESPDQKKPLPRGSGEINLKDILEK